MVDAVSCREPSVEAFPGKNHFLECSFSIADPALDEKLRSSGILDALRSGKYERFACDINVKCGYVSRQSPNGLPWAYPNSELVSDDEYLERAARNARWLRREYSGYIHGENLNYFPTGAYERVCEPDFIRRVTEAANIGLLLDIAHAKISAHYMGYHDPMDYFFQLPLERVQELHVSRAGFLNGSLEDLHEAPEDFEFDAVNRIIGRAPNTIFLTVEYYRNPDILCDVFRRLAMQAGDPGLRNTRAQRRLDPTCSGMHSE
jgi:sugar phosphate isomerase/epimerase